MLKLCIQYTEVNKTYLKSKFFMWPQENFKLHTWDLHVTYCGLDVSGNSSDDTAHSFM